MNHDNRITAEGLRAAVEAERLARVSRTIPASQLAPRTRRTTERRPGMTVREASAVLVIIAVFIAVTMAAQYGGMAQ